MPKTVLMCPPTFFDVRENKNPHMGQPIDRKKAQQQWDNLRRSLEDSGLKVELIDPVKDLEDMVFAANQVFIGQARNGEKFIVPSHMRFPSRHQEVSFYVNWFRGRGYRVINLPFGEDYLEGHGDLLWHPDHSRIWAAYGFRSTRGGVDKFSAVMTPMGFPVTPLKLVDPYCYHLDTCLCPLNQDAALIYPGAFSPPSLASILAGFPRVYELTREEAVQFMGNGIVVNGRFLTPRLNQHLSQILSKENLKPIVVDTSEFEKSGGSVFCMKAFLD
jgi:N-dimethylarginine dimethylaminohydrolase